MSHRDRGAITTAVAAALLLLSGCGETLVDVYFEADPVLAERATQLLIRVTNQDGTVVFEEQVESPTFPAAVRVRPEGGDATRTFVVSGELADANGVFARVEQESAFVDGACQDVRLRFDGFASPLLSFGVERFDTDLAEESPVLLDGSPFEILIPGSADNGVENWLVFVTAHLSTDAPSSADIAFELGVSLDGAKQMRATVVGAARPPFASFMIAAPGQTISFRARGTSGFTGSIEDLRVVLVPLPDSPLTVTQAEGSIPLRMDPPGAFGEFLQLDEVPAGDYLVLARAESEATMYGPGAGFQLIDQNAAIWPDPTEAGPRKRLATWSLAATFVLARRVTLVEPGMFALQGIAAREDPVVTMRGMIAAIPLENLRYTGTQALRPHVAETGASYETTLEVPISTRGTFVLASAVVSSALDPATDSPDRLVRHSIVGQPDQIWRHSALGQNRVNHSALWLLGADESATVGIESSSPRADALDTKEVVIHALGFN